MMQRPDIAKIAEYIRGSLVRATIDNTGTVVRTPLLFPSGSTVQVRIECEDSYFFVSDMAQALREAEMLGGEKTFAFHAPVIAANAGVGFDRQSFFVSQAFEKQLLGAVTSIANCSAEAAQIVAFNIADRKGDDYVSLLQERLVEIFPTNTVAKDIEVMGASATKWAIDASVCVNDQLSLFDVVSDHPASIASAVTKFSDIAALPKAPNRIAVLKDRKKLGTRLAVLARTADVLEFGAPDSTFRQLANAA